MLQIARLVTAATLALGAVTPLSAADSDRDFSGRWDLDRNASDLRALSAETYEFLAVEQNTQIHCAAIDARGASIQWTYFLNGGESKYQIGAESMNSVAKWEGDALLINTLVSGPQNYAVMDRWTLSRDRRQLTIQRQISRGAIQAEGRLVYGHLIVDPATPRPDLPVTGAAPKPALPAQPGLTAPPAPPPPPLDFTIAAGTHILLSLTSSISTKNSKEGDRVYLQTAM